MVIKQKQDVSTAYLTFLLRQLYDCLICRAQIGSTFIVQKVKVTFTQITYCFFLEQYIFVDLNMTIVLVTNNLV